MIAGLCYGTMNVFAKMAYAKGMIVSRFVMMRFATLFFLSYVFGKVVRKTNFDLRKYNKKVVFVVVLRSALSLFSKTMQYAAILYIPLSMSSCISFTTGPIFAALLAFILIKEKLTISESFAIFCGIVGTAMLTMPQWFLFLGLDVSNITTRLASDEKEYSYYYFGIIIALASSALDTVTYFIIRSVGTQIPKAIFPFISGLFSTTCMMIYCFVYEPLDWWYFFTPAEDGVTETSEYT